MNRSRLLPPISEEYKGPPIPYYYLVLVAVVSTARSLVHILAPDGGASSIAGLAVDVAGGSNIVAMFGQWGASQLILALFYWLAVLRYRFLVPTMLALVALEQALRIGVGQLKSRSRSPPLRRERSAATSCFRCLCSRCFGPCAGVLSRRDHALDPACGGRHREAAHP